MEFFESLGDGWSIYLWLIIGGMIIAASIYWIRWASKHEQFDEDIKYLVFDENDQDKMLPEEYAKSRAVLEKQQESRAQSLQQQEQEALKSH